MPLLRGAAKTYFDACRRRTYQRLIREIMDELRSQNIKRQFQIRNKRGKFFTFDLETALLKRNVSTNQGLLIKRTKVIIKFAKNINSVMMLFVYTLCLFCIHWSMIKYTI